MRAVIETGMKSDTDDSVPGVGQGDWGLQETLACSVSIMEEGEVLVHPEPFWSYNFCVLNQLTQDQQDVIGPVLRCHELLDLIGAQGVLQKGNM